MKELLVYIAGPLGTVDPWTNAHNAMRYGQRICELGHVAVVPHEHVIWATVCPGQSHQEWLRRDLAVLRRCDCLIRLPGDSPGADREVKEAEELGLPHYFAASLDDVPDAWIADEAAWREWKRTLPSLVRG